MGQEWGDDMTPRSRRALSTSGSSLDSQRSAAALCQGSSGAKLFHQLADRFGTVRDGAYGTNLFTRFSHGHRDGLGMHVQTHESDILLHGRFLSHVALRYRLSDSQRNLRTCESEPVVPS